MKHLIAVLSLVALLARCGSAAMMASGTDDQAHHTDASTPPVDTTPKVTGIGGIFFFSDNPQETRAWYAKNLGLDINSWGTSSFESRNVNKPDEINSLQWRPFKTGAKYFSPSTKDFMLNYQVQNIEGLVHKLRENGVTVLDTMAAYDYGKFIHIMDAEGNKIELWEPVAGREGNPPKK